MGKQILVGNNFNFKNRIINGDFQVWQRGEDISISKQNGYIGVDRFFTWQEGIDSDGNTINAVCDVENKKEYSGQDIISSYYISNTDTSLTNTVFGVTQRVEPINYWNLINKEITISFWIKTNKSIFNFYIQHDYIDSNGNKVGELIYSEDIPIQPNIWTKIERTVTLSSTNYITIDKEIFTELFGIKIYDIADNDYIQLKQIQVEKGDIASEFEYIPYDIQLQRCMRYYEKIEGKNGVSYDGSNLSFTGNRNVIFRVKKIFIPSILLIEAASNSQPEAIVSTKDSTYITADDSASGNYYYWDSLIADAEL